MRKAGRGVPKTLSPRVLLQSPFACFSLGAGSRSFSSLRLLRSLLPAARVGGLLSVPFACFTHCYAATGRDRLPSFKSPSLLARCTTFSPLRVCVVMRLQSPSLTSLSTAGRLQIPSHIRAPRESLVRAFSSPRVDPIQQAPGAPSVPFAFSKQIHPVLQSPSPIDLINAFSSLRLIPSTQAPAR